MTNVQAIKAFFEQDGSRRITMDELKALSPTERQDLGQLCALALGVELTPPGTYTSGESIALPGIVAAK